MKSALLYIYISISHNTKTMFAEIRAICHPPPKTDPAYKGLYLRADELSKDTEHSKAFGSYVGKPVKFEHGRYDQTEIGLVTEVGQMSNGWLYCDLLVDMRTPLGKWTVEEMKQGRAMDVSIGFDRLKNVHTKESSNMTPREISIVRRGALEKSNILLFNIDEKQKFLFKDAFHLFKSGISPNESQQLKSRMETTKPVETTQTATPINNFAQELLKNNPGMTLEGIQKIIDDKKRETEAKQAELSTKLADKEKGLPVLIKRLVDKGLITNEQSIAFGKEVASMVAHDENPQALSVFCSLNEDFHAQELEYQKHQAETKKLQDELAALKANTTAASQVGLQDENERKRHKTAVDIAAAFVPQRIENSATPAASTAATPASLAAAFNFEAMQKAGEAMYANKVN